VIAESPHRLENLTQAAVVADVITDQIRLAHLSGDLRK
jgi:hypothetical protein